MSEKVYPIGYNAPDAQSQIDGLMADSKVLMIDIRYKPYSWRAGWKKEDLAEKYGERYRWAGAYLGNLNYQDGTIRIANIEVGMRGLNQYLSEGYDLILLCQCAAYEDCHRRAVTEILKQVRPSVEVVLPAEVETISCLSIQQPWSWLIVHGLKDTENRDWIPDDTGPYPLLVHAGKQVDRDCFCDDGSLSPGFERKYGKALAQMMPQHKKDYATGVLVGIVHMTGVVTKSESSWFRGKYGFALADARPLLEPIPYRGAQNIFPVSSSVVAGVKYGTALTPPLFKEPEVLTPKDEAIMRTARIEIRCTNLGIFLDELMVRLFNGMRSVESLDQQEYARLNTALLRLELDESKKKKKVSRK